MQAGITVDDLAISIGLPSEEAAFVAELQSGSEQAFAQLIDRYHQQLYSLIARSLQDPADAADITQDVFLKVFRSIRGFHGESSLRTWLYRIALREASNQRRWWSRHRRREIDLDAPSSSHCAAEFSADAHSLGSTLAAAGSSPFDYAAQQEVRERVEAALRPAARESGHRQIPPDARPRRTARRACSRGQHLIVQPAGHCLSPRPAFPTAGNAAQFPFQCRSGP